MSDSAAAWNSLEVTKLAAEFLGPVVLAAIGFRLSRALRRHEAVQWANQKIVEKRIKVYEELAPCLNRVYCFFAERGDWKEITPPAAIALKRQADRIAHVNAALFSAVLMDAYDGFMKSCFRTYNDVGADAQLRASLDHHRRGTAPWDDAWDELFLKDEKGESTDKRTINDAYHRLMSEFATELGVGLSLDGLATLAAHSARDRFRALEPTRTQRNDALSGSQAQVPS